MLTNAQLGLWPLCWLAFSREAGHVNEHSTICSGEREEREVTFFENHANSILTMDPSS